MAQPNALEYLSIAVLSWFILIFVFLLFREYLLRSFLELLGTFQFFRQFAKDSGIGGKKKFLAPQPVK